MLFVSMIVVTVLTSALAGKQKLRVKKRTLTMKRLECYTCRKAVEGKDEEEDTDTERS